MKKQKNQKQSNVKSCVDNKVKNNYNKTQTNTNKSLGFDKDTKASESHSFALDENDDHSFELR